METFKLKWIALTVKEQISYYVSFVLFFVGILIAFLSVFLHQWVIESSVLIFISQCFIIAASLIGSAVYFHSKWVSFNTAAKNDIREQVLKQIEDHFLGHGPEPGPFCPPPE